MADGENTWQTYGAAIIGNYCGHGSAIVSAFRKHPRIRLIGGFEPDERRGRELTHVMGLPTVSQSDLLLQDPEGHDLAAALDLEFQSELNLWRRPLRR